MNFNLIPCCIVDCDGTGQYQVSGNQGTVRVCAIHALEMAELHKQAKEELRRDNY